MYCTSESKTLDAEQNKSIFSNKGIVLEQVANSNTFVNTNAYTIEIQ